MGMFDFVKSVGKKLGFGGDEEAAPTADALKKELDSHKLGTDSVAGRRQGRYGRAEGRGQGSVDLRKGGHRRRQHARRFQGAGRRIAGRARGRQGSERRPRSRPSTPVKKGDNLWKIAEKSYGKGKGAKNTVIFEANKPMLKHPDKIYPGQVLRIPTSMPD